MKEFGDYLKKFRLLKGMSQEELAGRINTKKQVISKYETNQRVPKVTVANQLAKELDVPLAWLMGDEKPAAENGELYKDGCSLILADSNGALPSSIKVGNENAFLISEREQKLVLEYRKLDEYGKGTVDIMIEREKERCGE